jgi:chromosome segregation ATPase
MKHRSLSLGFFLLALAVVCSAQTQDTANKDSRSAKPAAPADKTASKQDAQATPEKKKPKKVWTNDEVATLPGTVSVVGQPQQRVENSRQTEEGSSSHAGDSQESQVDNYRQQIGDLRNQIDAADQRIAELKNFKGENASPTGGINPNQGYNMVPVEDQIKQLEAKKKKLQGQIDDLENEARKNGIDPGKLR